MSKHNKHRQAFVPKGVVPDGWQPPENARIEAVVVDDAPSPALRDLPGPYAIGWAIKAVKDGYVRVRVRIPLDVLEELAIGPASAPDLRSNQAAWIQLEIMQDEALQQIHGGRGRE